MGTSETRITKKAKDKWSICLQKEAMLDIPLGVIKLLV